MAYKKFDIGEAIRFDVETNTHYLAHNGHQGLIRSIESYKKHKGPGTVVVYEIECECGSVLHPQAHHVALAR